MEDHMKRSIFAGMLFLGAAGAAGAVDLPNSLVMPLKAPALTAAPCTVTSCSGFYVGGFVLGNGTNLDVIGSGLSGTFAAQGSSMGIVAGYQSWNGNLFLGGEVFGGINISQTNAMNVGPSSKFVTGELVKVGGNLAGLFSSGPTTPSQGPIAINIPGLALMSPYALVGDFQRGSKNGVATGAGTEFIAGGGINIDLKYIHVNYSNGQVAPNAALDTENIVMLSALKKF
jgi:opacity protein-like surface antigen